MSVPKTGVLPITPWAKTTLDTETSSAFERANLIQTLVHTNIFQNNNIKK